MREADARPVTFSAPPKASPGRGGNGLSQVAIDAGTARFDDPSLSGYYLETKRVAQLSDKLLNFRPQRICKMSPIGSERADIIGAGTLILSVFLEQCGLSGITVSAARASLWTLGTHASRERCEH